VTNEQKAFIAFSDLLALEFRCRTCGSSVRRPLDAWLQPPGICGNCQTIWMSDGGERHKFLNAAVATIKRLARTDDEAKYELRAEIKGRKSDDGGDYGS
jgi:hypothetical protein